jgi:hypothetical protein
MYSSLASTIYNPLSLNYKNESKFSDNTFILMSVFVISDDSYYIRTIHTTVL